MADIIDNVSALRRFKTLAQSQIVVVGGVFDSNGNQQDQTTGLLGGWPSPYMRMLGSWLGLAGTGLPTVVATDTGIGSDSGISRTAAIPAGYQQWLMPATITGGDNVSTGLYSGFMNNAAFYYTADGATTTSDQARSMMSLGDTSNGLNNPVFPTTSAMTVLMRYATFVSGSGTPRMWPTARRTASGLTVYGGGTSVNPITGTLGLADYEFNILANAVPAGVGYQIEPVNVLANDWVGPGIILNNQAVFTGVTTGIVYNVLQIQGGMGSIEACISVFNATNVAMTEWVRAIVRPQVRLGQNPTMVLHHVHGANDVNDSGQASYDPTTLTRIGASSDTPTGRTNNIISYYRRWLQIWVAMGFDPDRLFLAIGPYHNGPAYAGRLQAYEASDASIAALYPRTVWCTRGSELNSISTSDVADWPRDGSGEDTDDVHMKRQGYYAFVNGAVNAWKVATASNTTFVSTVAGRPRRSIRT